MGKRRKEDDCLADLVRHGVVSVDGIHFDGSRGQGFSVHSENVLTRELIDGAIDVALQEVDFDQDIRTDEEPFRVLIMTVQVAVYRLPVERKGG